MSQEPSPATPRGAGVDRELLALEVEAEADRLERESVYSAQGITRDWLRSVAEGIRKISAPSETLCIPEGWKLVPMKATSAMVKAAIDYHYDVEQSEGMAGVYRIMINAAPQDDCHTSGRAQGQRSGKSLDQREAGLPVGAAPVSVPSAIGFKAIGSLYRPRSGDVRFSQDTFSIPLPVHGSIKVYIKEGE